MARPFRNSKTGTRLASSCRIWVIQCWAPPQVKFHHQPQQWLWNAQMIRLSNLVTDLVSPKNKDQKSKMSTSRDEIPRNLCSLCSSSSPSWAAQNWQKMKNNKFHNRRKLPFVSSAIHRVSISNQLLLQLNFRMNFSLCESCFCNFFRKELEWDFSSGRKWSCSKVDSSSSRKIHNKQQVTASNIY